MSRGAAHSRNPHMNLPFTGMQNYRYTSGPLSRRFGDRMCRPGPESVILPESVALTQDVGQK